MAQPVKDSFLDLERHRQLLEENIEALRKSLRHWQIWEAEYEGLKEEIAAAGPNPTREQLHAIGQAYEGEMVTAKEVEDILGLKAPRDADQVINILSRRIDYVQQNVRSIEKQIEGQEKKLTAATIISNPEVRNEEGLPMTDIIEELDEDGNIIASHTSTPGSSKSQLIEVLQKAGIKELPGPVKKETPQNIKPSSKPKDPDDVDESNLLYKIEQAVEQQQNRAVAQKPALRSQGVDQAKQQKTKPIIYQNPGIKPGEAVIPTDESEDDAVLRKQMLEYGMSEVGAVVAELDLEDGDSSNDDDDEYFEEGYSSMEDDDDEDQFGKSTRSVVDEDLKQQMLELEQRLGVRMMENVGPNRDKPVQYEAVETSQEQNTVREKTEDTGVAKKAVRFADSLDISPAPSSPPTLSQSKSLHEQESSTPALGDVVERTSPRQMSSTSAPSKVSRFKSARSGNKPAPSTTDKNSISDRTRELPTGPPGQTLADAIVEREIAPGPAPEPDDLDPALLRQQAATEYYRTRNRLIQRQGGFKAEAHEEDTYEIGEDGVPKKLSRFKAARLGRQ